MDKTHLHLIYAQYVCIYVLIHDVCDPDHFPFAWQVRTLLPVSLKPLLQVKVAVDWKVVPG